ncbi:eukaryotic protein [Schizosaccharomyces japonicus yFS275]|uniref:Eukaryotic protein n=1 Tax=Schizosaccharomyces japonicus (strain yFS275 / FY16936) TaxID=402676 RepID=B6JYA3_SCHJY|nr:eukaryotic protein [Schizosaccharomyces japonicus yFS275]EEB06521.1 eukaryotic protein [Schizosaccharomyces japonicus yFS275]
MGMLRAGIGLFRKLIAYLTIWKIAFVLLVLHTLFWIIGYCSGWRFRRIGFFSIHGLQHTFSNGSSIIVPSFKIRVHRPSPSNPYAVTFVIKGLTITQLNLKNSVSSTRNESQKGANASGPRHLVDCLRLFKIQKYVMRVLRSKFMLMIHITFREMRFVLQGGEVIEFGSVSLGETSETDLIDTTNVLGGDLQTSHRQLFIRFIDLVLVERNGEQFYVNDFTTFSLSFKNAEELFPKTKKLLDVFELGIKIGRLDLNLNSPLFIDMFSKSDKRGETDACSSHQESSWKLKDEDYSALLLQLQEVHMQVGTFSVVIQHFVEKNSIHKVKCNDIGFTFNKLNQNNSSYRLFFDQNVTAHQVLLTALNVNIENLLRSQKKHVLLDVPLLTVTGFTSMFTQLFCTPFSHSRIRSCPLRIESSVASPCLDVRLHFVQQFIDALRNKTTSSTRSKSSDSLFSKFCQLPSLDVSLNMNHPTFRLFISSVKDPFNYDSPGMLVASLSTMRVNLHPSDNEKLLSAVKLAARLGNNTVFFLDPQNNKSTVNLSDTIHFTCDYSFFEQKARIECDYQRMAIFVDQKAIIDCLKRIQHTVLDIKRDFSSKSGKARPKKQSDCFLPQWLQHFKLYGSGFDMSVCDYENEKSNTSCGAHLRIRNMEVKTTGRNKPLEHTQDIRFGFHHVSLKSKLSSISGNYHETLLLVAPQLTLYHTTIFEPRSKNVLTRLHGDINALRGEYSMLDNFCLLKAFDVLRSILSKPENEPASKNLKGKQAILPYSHEKQYDIRVRGSRFKMILHDNARLLLDITDLHMLKEQRSRSWELTMDSLQIHTWSKDDENYWLPLILLTHIHYFMTKSDHQRMLHHFNTNSICIRIPHGFIPYKLIESLINTVKGAIRLVKPPITVQEQHVQAQIPNEPKISPHINIKASAFNFEIEDDPFEVKLAIIFRTGLAEQELRQSRWEAFENRVMKLRTRYLDDTFSNSSFDFNTSFKDYQSHAEDPEVNDATEQKRVERLNDLNKSFAEFFMNNDDNDEQFFNNLSVTVTEARQRLMEYDSLSWIVNLKRVRGFRYNRLKRKKHDVWIKVPSLNDNVFFSEKILPISVSPPLMDIAAQSFDFTMDKPTFPLDELPEFLNRVGNGQPKDYQYSIYFPMSIDWKMNQASLYIRDYPIPMIFIPAQPKRCHDELSSWLLKSNIVITEQVPTEAAIRDVTVQVVPAKLGSSLINPFAVNVTRTVSPIKTFSDTRIYIRTPLPTTLLWCTSYQPAFSDIIRITDSFTKLPVDPSEKLGFWDKLRLITHSQIRVRWVGNGDVLFSLKGSRDPYITLGSGAGFQKCWSGNVAWDINCDKDPRNFMTVDSNEFYLSVPDFPKQASTIWNSMYDETTDMHDMETKDIVKSRDLRCRKIIAKLVGQVRWRCGFVPERACGKHCDKCNGQRKCRLWNFKPHWDIVTRIPKFCEPDSEGPYDAYRGFRSDFFHCSLALESPRFLDDENRYSEVKSSNTIHLTPLVFAHFFDWWRLFSNNMSYPLRSGSLYPSENNKPDKKFGRYLATFKYCLEIAPLFISHVYRYKTSKDLHTKCTSTTGIKAKVERFTIDLHQRKEKHVYLSKDSKLKEVSTMKMHLGKVDFRAVDLRVLNALFDESNVESDNNYQHQPAYFNNTNKDMFEKVEGPLEWIDQDDFHEIDWLLPQFGSICSIYPFAYSPRFTYYRHTVAQHEPRKNKDGQKPECRFNQENTHRCLLSEENTSQIQTEILDARQEELKALVVESEERIAKLNSLPNSATEFIQKEIEKERKSIELVHANIRIFDQLRKLALENTDEDSAQQSRKTDHYGFVYARFSDSITEFNNRFVVHNVQIKWNHFVRDTFLEYINEVDRRRGFSYYMSQRAIRFLQGLLEKQEAPVDTDFFDTYVGPRNEEKREETKNLIKFLMDDIDKHFVVKCTDSGARHPGATNSSGSFSLKDEHYDLVNSYIFRFIAPQIQFQSAVNPNTSVIVSVQSMQMKILSVLDPSLSEDDLNNLVEQRFLVNVSESQFFIAKRAYFSKQNAKFLVANNYGSDANSFYPPWVPLEATFDFVLTPPGFFRFLDRISFSAEYTKHNALRLKRTVAATNGHFQDLDSHTNTITVDFPKVVCYTDSSQYYEIFTIVTNLLLYKEPNQKRRSKRIEEILLTADFTDLEGTPEIVRALQRRIRNYEAIKQHYQLYDITLNVQRHVKQQYFLQNEIFETEEELFYIMESIALAQRQVGQSDRRPRLSWLIMTKEVIWHLLDEHHKKFLDIALYRASFRRVDNTDSSNSNTVEIGLLKGTSLFEGARFSNVISPYFEVDSDIEQLHQEKLIRIHWQVQDAVAGIPLFEHVECSLFPLRLQLEQELVNLVFNYVFPKQSEGMEGASILSRIRKRKQQSDSKSDKPPVERSASAMSRVSSRTGSTMATSRVQSSQMSVANTYFELDEDARAELNTMLERAGSFFAVTYFKVPSVVLCFSYHGQGHLGLDNITDFVFTMPTMEYRNEIWSLLEVTMQLKHDMLRVILNHSGKLILEKFTGTTSKNSNSDRLEQELEDPETGFLSSYNDETVRSLTAGQSPVLDTQTSMITNAASIRSRHSQKSFWKTQGRRSKQISQVIKKHIPHLNLTFTTSSTSNQEQPAENTNQISKDALNNLKREIVLGDSSGTLTNEGPQ